MKTVNRIMIILAYPGEDSGLNDKHRELEKSVRARKPLAEVVFFNTWVN
ncbi:hypothetical protein [Oceanispirochaeta sp.]|nr:hypothetical protein [Oceanispirochaeta sp.]MDA3957343.1 hypothetical protein [Oceanispirochaeta sp.]